MVENIDVKKLREVFEEVKKEREKLCLLKLEKKIRTLHAFLIYKYIHRKKFSLDTSKEERLIKLVEPFVDNRNFRWIMEQYEEALEYDWYEYEDRERIRKEIENYFIELIDVIKEIENTYEPFYISEIEEIKELIFIFYPRIVYLKEINFKNKGIEKYKEYFKKYYSFVEEIKKNCCRFS